MASKNSYNQAHVTAIILAGGQGSRAKGRDKGWLNWQEKPLITQVYEKISTQVDKVIISCNRNIERYKELAINAVSDERFGFLGPLAGIESAGKLVETAFTVVVPCDVPTLPNDLVERLLDPFELQKDLEVTFPWDGERPQFLITAIKLSALQTITICLNEGGRSMRDWHSYVKVKSVDFSDRGYCFANINHIP